MGRMKSNETRVAAAHSSTVSVRTTIPSHIAERLGLEAGDTLTWEIDKDGKSWFVRIRKS